MPYSITTRDGITIDNIPDDMPADSPQLKERVAQIRGGQPKQPASDVRAPTSGVVMGLRDAVDAGAQMLRRAAGDKVGGAIDTFGNWLAEKGLPVAKSEGVEGVDRIVNEVNKGYEANRRAPTVSGLVTGQQPEPGFDWPRLAGNLIQPANYVGGGVAGANTVRALATAGARAGAVSGALQPVVGEENQQNFWTEKGQQAGTGAVAGAVLTPTVAKGAEKAGNVIARNLPRRAAQQPQNINIAVNNTFTSQGMDPREVPEVVLQSVRRQIDEAMRQGHRLDPAAMVRRAQFEAVGLTDEAAPTAGQLTRNPTQYANEVNLAQVRIRTPQGEGNPLADRFNAQNRRLQDVFRRAGAADATDRTTAGQTVMGALRDADRPVRAGVDEAYTAARAMTGGRAADLDRAAFSQAANRALDEGMLGRYVPPEVRGMLNDVSDGSMPFTVEAAEQFDSIMSAAQRRFGQGSPEWMAIGRIRTALHDAPFVRATQESGEGAAAAAARTVDDLGAPIVDVPFRPAGGPQRALPPPQGGAVSFQIPQPQPGAAVDEGAAAREAFAQARAAARQRFATIEATPALRAALDNEAPDNFVRQFIIGADVRDLQAMRRILENSPEAMSQARAQVAAHLRNAAFGANGSGDKVFAAERYLQTLNALGPQKLGVFFSPAEMVQLNLAGRVASDINSPPAGAKPNFSGTGGALMNLLSRIAEAPMIRQIPFARAAANQIGESRTETLINQSLRPPVGTPQPPRQLTPSQVRAMQFFFSPSGVAGGVLAGSAANQ